MWIRTSRGRNPGRSASVQGSPGNVVAEVAGVRRPFHPLARLLLIKRLGHIQDILAFVVVRNDALKGACLGQ